MSEWQKHQQEEINELEVKQSKLREFLDQDDSELLSKFVVTTGSMKNAIEYHLSLKNQLIFMGLYLNELKEQKGLWNE